MGNFSVNHYAKIRIGQTSVEILYLVDRAEIPTYQEMRQFGITARPDDPADSHYLDGQQAQLKQGLILEIDGQAVDLATVSRQVAFSEGAGGLPTMKISVVLQAKLDVRAGAHQLSYVDNNFPGRAGWKEIVVLGDRIHHCRQHSSRRGSQPGTDQLLDGPIEQSAAATCRSS